MWVNTNSSYKILFATLKPSKTQRNTKKADRIKNLLVSEIKCSTSVQVLLLLFCYLYYSIANNHKEQTHSFYLL